MIDKFGRTELGRYFYGPSSSSGITGDLYIRTDGNRTITLGLDFNGSGSCRFGFKFSQGDQFERTYQSTQCRYKK